MRTEPSGKFVLRVAPEIHGELKVTASRLGKSLNEFCVDLLQKGLHGKTAGKASLLPEGKKITSSLRKKFGRHLLGVLVFGSQARAEADPWSDVDLLIVVDETIPIERPLYRWWDEALEAGLPKSINPQFVRPPSDVREAGGLWFEVALAHEILWEKRGLVSDLLERLKETIASGAVRRYTTQGQPYWVRREDAE